VQGVNDPIVVSLVVPGYPGIGEPADESDQNVASVTADLERLSDEVGALPITPSSPFAVHSKWTLVPVTMSARRSVIAEGATSYSYAPISANAGVPLPAFGMLSLSCGTKPRGSLANQDNRSARAASTASELVDAIVKSTTAPVVSLSKGSDE
jgi:hypothetical protein